MAGTHWLTEVIWAALGAPGHHVSRLVSVGLPKMPRSSPLVLLELQYYSLRAETDGERGREGERDARRVFFLLSCISSCNSTQPTRQWAWSSHMCSPIPPFYISPACPISLPPFLVADLSAAFCPLVASHLEKHCTVISVSPAHLPASLPVSLLVRLPASVPPTAMPYSCPIHLVLNKRLLSSGHPSLCWPLYFCGEAQKWGLALKGIDCWGRLGRNAWMHTLVRPSCFCSVW